MLSAMVLFRTSTVAVPVVGTTLTPPALAVWWLPLLTTLTSRRVRRPLPATTPGAVWSYPSTVRFRNVTVRPSATVTFGAKLVKPGGRRSTADAPVPCSVPLRLMGTWPAKGPARTLTVELPGEEASARATVANGLAGEAEAQDGSDVAEA